MKRRASIAAISTTLCALGLAACANRPLPTVPPLETQPRMEAAKHWQHLAEHTADEIVQAVGLPVEQGGRVEARRLRLPPVYVPLPDPASAFERGFHALLTTELVRHGAEVIENQVPGAAVVSTDVEVIAYARDVDFRSVPGIATGAATAGGLYWFELLGGAAGQALGVGAGALALDSLILFEVPDTEIIVSTSVHVGGGYAMRKSTVHYIKDADRRLYTAPPPALPARSFALVDCPSPGPCPQAGGRQ